MMIKNWSRIVLLAVGGMLCVPVLSFAQGLANMLSSPDTLEVIKEYGEVYGVNAAGASQGGGSFAAKAMAGLIFGGIGFVAFVYGKKESSWKPMVIGVLLIAYPYLVSGTLALFGIGIGLVALLYFWRD